MLSLGCCASAFCSCSGRAYSLVAVRGLLIVMASLVAEDRPRVHRLSSVGNALKCSMACRMFLDQGQNLRPLHFRRILNHWTTRKVLHSVYLEQMP